MSIIRNGFGVKPDQVKQKPEITAAKIKAALIWYYRFRRNCVCADEVTFNNGLSDVVIDNGKAALEIEVKISRNDLCVAEFKKAKYATDPGGPSWPNYTNQCPPALIKPNRFYFCVPETLCEDALEVIQKVNPKIGLIIYQDFYTLHFRKQAKCLGNPYDRPAVLEQIARRACSSLASKMRDHHTKNGETF